MPLTNQTRRRVAAALAAITLSVTAVGQASMADVADDSSLEPGAVVAPETTQDELDLGSPRASGADTAEDRFATESETGLWVVRVEGDSVAAYLAQERPEGSPDAVAFEAQVEDRQESVQSTIDATLGREVEVEDEFVQVLNGFSVRVDKGEAARIAELPGVTDVVPDVLVPMATDVSHEIINSDAVWAGDTLPELPTQGEGVVVAMFDSGVNPGHPSFAAEAEDGYVHQNPLGEGNYLGACDPEAEEYDPDFPCNAKLIGAYDSFAGADAWDDNGHGSHVGSTIAGTAHTARFTFGGTEIEREVRGVAPRANIVSFKTCYFGSCSPVATVSAVEEVVEQGIDVINYSISGDDNPWSYIVDQAFLDATAAGVTVVAATGNSGPDLGTTNHPAPWVTAVAATAQQRVFAHAASVTGPQVPARLRDFSVVPADPTGTGLPITGAVDAPLLLAASVSPGNADGCLPYPPGQVRGAWVVVARGADCSFNDKARMLSDAGAVGAVWYHEFAGPPLPVTGLASTGLPSVWTDAEDGRALAAALEAGDVTRLQIDPTVEVRSREDWQDVVGEFSSRGPGQYDLQVPTVAAPGVNILAATMADGETTDTYEVMRGTSMASPHVAGSAALLRALYPDLDPTGIRSMLATSAQTDGLIQEDGVTAARPLDVGSGRIDVALAARTGLVLTETRENFQAADPEEGGDPRTLNTPNVLSRTCDYACTFTRSVTSVLDEPATYRVSVQDGDGMVLEADPAQFTVAPGQTQEIVLTADVSDGDLGGWVSGRVVLESADEIAGEPLAPVGIPVTVTPTADYDPSFPPAITLSEPGLVLEQEPDTVSTHEVEVANEGQYRLDWEVVDTAREAVRDLVDQPTSGPVGIPSGTYTLTGAQVTAVDDFVLEETMLLDRLQVGAAWSDGEVFAYQDLTTGWTWTVFEDDDGEPGEPVWEHDAPLNGRGVLVDEGLEEDGEPSVALDITRAEGEPLRLDPGRYWLSFRPTSLVADIRWDWLPGSGGGGDALFIDPDDIFKVSATDWVPLDEVLPGASDLALTLEGSGAPFACGADWAGVTPREGEVAGGASSSFEVQVDTSGLDPGEYSTTLCVQSSDPEQPLTELPIDLTVTGDRVAPEVVRVEGADRYDTAARISERFPDGVQTVYLANGQDDAEGADALAAGAAAAGDVVTVAGPDGAPAPLLLVQQDRVPEDTLRALEALKPRTAVVLGGDAVVSDRVARQVTGLGVQVERVQGRDRYGTAAALAGFYEEAETVYVALGEGRPGSDTALADALAASSVAGAQGAPVLLTKPERLPGDTARAIRALAPERIVLVGGRTAVSDQVERDLRALATTERVEGATRYHTAAALVEDYAPDGAVTYVASGTSFPDALAVSPLSGSQGAPLLLVNDRVPTATRDAVLDLSPQGITVVGGGTAISRTVVAALQALLDRTATD